MLKGSLSIRLSFPTGLAIKAIHVLCILMLFVLSPLWVCCARHPAARAKPAEVTVEQLLSAPERFDGSRVLIKGFLLQPMIGNTAIYQKEPDYHHPPLPSGIRLELEPEKRNHLMPFQLKPSVVEGTFRVSHASNGRNWIEEVTRLELAD
jgi:hypothetical protein